MAFFKQTTLLRPLFLLVLLVIVSNAPTAAAEDDYICNICGEGNSIQFPTGVVEFDYRYVKGTHYSRRANRNTQPGIFHSTLNSFESQERPLEKQLPDPSKYSQEPCRYLQALLPKRIAAIYTFHMSMHAPEWWSRIRYFPATYNFPCTWRSS